MHKLTAAFVVLSSLTLAAPAFAALDAWRNEKGEEIQAEIKDGKLVDGKGQVPHDGDWTWVKDGKSVKVTIKGSLHTIKQETIPPIKMKEAAGKMKAAPQNVGK
jgi:hypothetical protein